MPTSSAADITVIYPAFDIRGSLSERLRTWACDQTLARDRYRIVVGVDSASPLQAREAEALLTRTGARRWAAQPRNLREATSTAAT
jgi:hypothetical protein